MKEGGGRGQASEPSPITVVVPGKAFLLGEYAVLFGEPAIVAAVGVFLELHGEPRRDAEVVFHGAKGGGTSLATGGARRRFPMLVAAYRAYEEAFGIRRGLTFRFAGGLTSDLGLGSSAACTVALLAGLALAEGERLSRRKLLDLALAAQQRVQPLNSGGDAAACVYGGVLCYRPAASSQRARVRRLDAAYSLDLFYTGRGVPTGPLVRQTLRTLRGRRGEGVRWLMMALARYGVAAWPRGDPELMGRLFLAYHLAMQSLGLVPPEAGAMQSALSEVSYGCKMSGAGSGDCLVAIGARGPLPASLERRRLSFRLGVPGADWEVG